MSTKSRAAYINYTFDPEGFRIMREIQGVDGEVLDSRMVSPREVAEIDDALVDEIVDFGIAHFPDLFGNIRHMDLAQVNELRVRLRRMTEAIGALLEYWRTQQVDTEPEPESPISTGNILGTVMLDDSSVSGQLVQAVSGEIESSVTTDEEGGFYISDLDPGTYHVSTELEDQGEVLVVDVVSDGTVRADFEFQSEPEPEEETS